jgi:hypothetical protein
VGTRRGGWASAAAKCVSWQRLRRSSRLTSRNLGELSRTGHLRGSSDQPVAEIVQCGEPILSMSYGDLVFRFVSNCDQTVSDLLRRRQVGPVDVDLARGRGRLTVKDLPASVTKAYLTYVEQLDAGSGSWTPRRPAARCSCAAPLP